MSVRTDVVTGATAEVELELPVSPERMWELVTDVTRIGEWSPECIEGEWLGGADRAVVGARFRGRNRFRNGLIGMVECEVTEVEPGSRFAWQVLADEVAGSYWRYELAPGSAAGTVLVRNVFEHGPGNSGVRVDVAEDPGHAQEIVNDRLATLRHNMAATLRAMAASA